MIVFYYTIVDNSILVVNGSGGMGLSIRRVNYVDLLGAERNTGVDPCR